MSIEQTFGTIVRAALLALVLAAACGLAGGDRPAAAQGLSDAQRESVLALARQAAADPVVVEAVKSQNAKRMPMAEIQRIQKEWKAGKADQLAKALMSNDCAKALFRTHAAEKGILEASAMDEQGARVCVTNRTSNYYRGDKAKFKEAYRGGQGGTYVGKPEFDASTQEYTVELSVPVMADGRAIGVVSFEMLARR